MIEKIIQFSVKNKVTIWFVLILWICFGGYQITNLPIDAVPDITDNQVQVITASPSFGASDIERFITYPIEQANSNIPGIQEIRSFSRFGLSLVTIVFEDDIDVYWARQQVSERLITLQSSLPQGMGTPELGPVSTGLGEIYQYIIKCDNNHIAKYSISELRTMQDWIVRRQLLGIEGIADVSSFGGKLKQYEIVVKSNRLAEFGIDISDVYNAVELNNQNTGGAYIDKGPITLSIKTQGLITSIDDIGSIPILDYKGNAPLLIRDVAEIKEGFATRYGALTYNGQGEAAGGIVMMLKGGNSGQVIEKVKERIAQIQKSLPQGVVIEPFLDRNKMVDSTMKTVTTNLLEGALIVLFILVLFLGNLRAGLIVASVIPLSMLFAVIMMNAFGVVGNLMSLGALDFGLIVDGTVVIVEGILYQLHHNHRVTNDYKPSISNVEKTVVDVSSKMAKSIFFGQLIIFIVYVPIFSLQGIEGKMFIPMVQTISFALIGALILSISYVPMMGSIWLRSETNENYADRFMYVLENKYQKALVRVLDHKKIVLGFAVVLFGFSLYILSTFGGEFIPELEEGDFAVEVRVLTGSNLQVSIASSKIAEQILLEKFDEVEKVITKIGSGEIPTDPMPMDAMDMMVILKDQKQWKNATTFQELANKMSEELKVVPGVTFSFQYPVQMRFNELMTGAKQDVVCKIFGENLDSLAHLGQILGKLVGKIEGASEIFIEPIQAVPQISIQFNRQKLAQYGISISYANDVINTAFAGKTAGQFYDEEKRFEIVVKIDHDEKQNISQIQNLLLRTQNGTQLPLSQVADVQIKNDPNQIQREDAKRRMVVGFNAKNRDVASIVKDVKSAVNEGLVLPPGYFITYGGQFENLENAKSRLMVAVPISLLCIFFLLFMAFGSIKQSAIIFTAVPLSIIGGVLFLALRDMPFSISAGIGFIALFGVAVLNGIVLVSEFNSLKKLGKLNTFELVIQGCKSRLRPVLMTACVASLGFLPMAINVGPGSQVQKPLATVVIGGVILATFLTLFVLPILYFIFTDKELKECTE